MVLGNPAIMRLPRVRPPALSLSIMALSWASSHGILGPPVRTWSTPSCLILRQPASSMVPAERPPTPISRQILGVSFPSGLGAGMSAASASAAKPADWIRVLLERLGGMFYSSGDPHAYAWRVGVGADRITRRSLAAAGHVDTNVDAARLEARATRYKLLEVA